MISSPYIQALFARAKAKKRYKERKEGPISGFVTKAIQNCITNRYLLNLFYEPGTDENEVAGYRWCEVYVWGLNKFTHNQHIRVFQYLGVSKTIVEGWKTFRLDRIRNTAVLTSKTFNKARPLYNIDGDLDMSTIFMQVKFPDEEN